MIQNRALAFLVTLAPALLAALSLALGLTLVAQHAHGAVRLTDNQLDDNYGGNHPMLHDGRMLWFLDDEDVIYHDGSTAVPIQEFDANDPALDTVMSFSSAFGAGPDPGTVMGAWRRGADHAWVWISGSNPVPIDTVAANQFDDPGDPKPTNPEGMAISDGCLFAIMQAVDGGMTFNHVFQIDPLTGAPLSLSGSDRINGVSAVRSDDCQSAWVKDPNGDGVSGLPFELQHFDGMTTTTLDSGAIDPISIFFRDGHLLYLKEVIGLPQVFHLDLNAASATPRQLSFDEVGRKEHPKTDGRHVTWLESVGEGLGLLRILGAPRATPIPADRVLRFGAYGYEIEDGQLTWRPALGQYFYRLESGMVTTISSAPAASVQFPSVHQGDLAWFGKPAEQGDDEIFFHDGVEPQLPASIPPPLFIDVEFRGERALIRHSEVLGADGYRIYYAAEAGVTPQNYASLLGGGMVASTGLETLIEGLTETGSYYFVVTATEGGTESDPSAELSPFGFEVDSPLDEQDADLGDGLCETQIGTCTLRAAVEEASFLANDTVIYLPAGSYVLDPGNGPLELAGARLVGDGIDVTLIEATDQDAVVRVDLAGVETRTRLSDLTLHGATRNGLVNQGHLELARVSIRDNGGPSNFGIGAGIYHSGSILEADDCLVHDNTTASHGGGLFIEPGIFSAVLRRCDIRGNTAGIGGGGFYSRGDVSVVESGIVANDSEFEQNWPGGGIHQENGAVRVLHSAIYGNNSGSTGGGVYTQGGSTLIVNSTISGNASIGDGAGLYAGAPAAALNVELRNVTLAGNNTDAQVASLGLHPSGDLLLANTIIAADGATNCTPGAPVQSLGYNIENRDDCGLSGTDQVDTDPALQPLQFDGGPTATRPTMPASPAIDAANPAGCAGPSGELLSRGQRGGTRHADGDGDETVRCDVGAHETAGYCGDDDGDGVGYCDGDCAIYDARIWAKPGPTQNLRFISKFDLTWDPPADPGAEVSTLRYDLHRSGSASDLNVDATCVGDQLPVLFHLDLMEPFPGQAFFYLSRAQNDCLEGEGSGGESSAGTPREIPQCQ
ncbi:hypothetical protein ABI59_20825 [Acidobacteria bacterium Mor1]|nr:hypothetical protein ABI59_20825 [Acidobacteria bacterium Mor1]